MQQVLRAVVRAAPVLALWFALGLLAPTSARAEYQIEGGIENLRIEATQTPIEEIFSALSAIYGVSIQASMLPDQPVTGVYTGPLQRIVAQLLERYDYVLAVSPEKIEITFLGARGGQGMVQVAQTSRISRAGVTRTPK